MSKRGRKFDHAEAAARAVEEEAEAKRLSELSRAMRTSSELRARVARLESELTLAEDRLDAMLSLRNGPVGSLAPIRISAKKKSAKNEATAFAILSDAHVEEEVRKEQVHGLNEYSLAIAERRLETFFRKALRLVEIQRAGTEIRTFVLGLLGDLFTGHIHEELAEITALSPTESVRWLLERLSRGIRFLLENGNFDRIIVPCAVGNHSRTQRKPRVTTTWKHSFEWLLYHELAFRFENEPKVEFRIPESYHILVDAHGCKVRMHHGDWMNYYGGVGGITIPLNKAIAAWNQSDPVDLDVLGHWHQYHDGPKAIINGSLIGYNVYGIRIKAAYEPPQQAFFLIGADHRRKTISAPIFVEKA